MTFTGGEVREPGRSLPRALLIGCFLVVALYLLANLAYVVTLPLSAIQNAPQNRVATALMQSGIRRARNNNYGRRDHDLQRLAATTV